MADNRNRDTTRLKILAAAGRIVTRDGFQKVRINTVAKAAGVDKVLIYRYFGGLSGLLNELTDQASLWPTMSELAEGDEALLAQADPQTAASVLLTGCLRQLQSRPLTVELLRWELVETNDLTARLAEARENQIREWLELPGFERLRRSGVDVEAVIALIQAGISHLILLSRHSDNYLQLDLTASAEWQRLTRAVEFLIERAFSHPA